MKRSLTPEILDFLPPDSPDARHSRRDLRLFNSVLGGQRWLGRTLCSRRLPGERVIEIGAGTGELGERLARQGLAIDGLDLGPRPLNWPASAQWHQTDALAFDGWQDYSVVVGNLIFHHFEPDALRELGGRMAAHARLIVACELTRKRHYQWLFAALCVLLRANHVSRHDGRVSIDAGFLGDELPIQLGLDPKLWQWRIARHGGGSYRMVAERHPG